MREIARLPEMTEEDVDFKREMLEQEQAMEYAETQMGMLGMQQKAEMTAQGFSPEQAQMASEQPTPEMAQQMRWTGRPSRRRRRPAGCTRWARRTRPRRRCRWRSSRPGRPARPPPPADPNEDKRFAREQQKAKMAEEDAQTGHKRETEKMRLAEQIGRAQAQAGHRRAAGQEEADRPSGQAAAADEEDPTEGEVRCPTRATSSGGTCTPRSPRWPLSGRDGARLSQGQARRSRSARTPAGWLLPWRSAPSVVPRPTRSPRTRAAAGRANRKRRKATK